MAGPLQLGSSWESDLLRQESEKGLGVQGASGLEGVLVLFVELVIKVRVQGGKAEGSSGLDGVLGVCCKKVKA